MRRTEPREKKFWGEFASAFCELGGVIVWTSSGHLSDKLTFRSLTLNETLPVNVMDSWQALFEFEAIFGALLQTMVRQERKPGNR